MPGTVRMRNESRKYRGETGDLVCLKEGKEEAATALGYAAQYASLKRAKLAPVEVAEKRPARYKD